MAREEYLFVGKDKESALIRSNPTRLLPPTHSRVLYNTQTPSHKIINPSTMSSPLRRSFMKNWFAVEAIPIWVIVGTVVSGGTWFMIRSAMGPTIQWTRSNPTPWNEIKPHQSTKLVQVNHKFDERWSREKL
ncbi:hypothetical protein D9757_000385 [Collybiopsis confluens]|uniref:Uncharacterized protein n=1 Tax=Collybiopsis confluens TaxID=2823264 RepID=A0A8H5I246_9AGAR|nr:hypothetical protein D9757_000385 [Collybiopsis confluens]